MDNMFESSTQCPICHFPWQGHENGKPLIMNYDNIYLPRDLEGEGSVSHFARTCRALRAFASRYLFRKQLLRNAADALE